MGFKIRSSIKAGPFRFNLSSGGIGMSVGVRGFRVGTGPRGNYVHMGGGGLYYRATISSQQPTTRSRIPAEVWPDPHPVTSPQERFESIESASVLTMTDESATGLLDQLRAAQNRMPIAPVAAIATAFVGLLLIGSETPVWLVCAVAALGMGITARARVRDVARRTVVLFYDLEPDARTAYERLHTAFANLAKAHGAWNVAARTDTDDSKRNAGATQLLRRQRVRLHMGVPGVIRTNIDVPAIPCGHETLHFLPDRLLVSSSQGIGTVSYDQLEIAVESSPFIEAERVPADASRVGFTWKYVNRNGSPDRRFANNQQLPVLLYEQICFTSPSGLHEILQLSSTGGGIAFRAAVKALSALARTGRGAVTPAEFGARLA